ATAAHLPADRLFQPRRGRRRVASEQESPMPKIAVAEGLVLDCVVDDYLWPWQRPVPVLMMHGFARNARFWHRWVPAIAETRRIYRPDLLGCGDSDVPPAGYRVSPE